MNITKKKNGVWQLYITRPFNLFECSLWNLWYMSKKTEEICGKRFTKTKYIEEYSGITKNYRNSKEMSEYKKRINKKVLQEPKKIIQFLKKGIVLNKKIKSGQVRPKTIDAALNEWIEVGLYCIIIPFFGYDVACKSDKYSKDDLKLFETLRADSIYKIYISEVLIPLIGRNIPNYEYCTLQEIQSMNISKSKERQICAMQGMYFIYEINGKNEKIFYRKPKLNSHHKKESINGKPAYPGKVQGVARVILHYNHHEINFNNGDILISTASNPMLMPLIKKSAALVTDEGGIACHAAIVAREMKKPCVIGTKIATKVFKDGDMVEVDANKGVVRKI